MRKNVIILLTLALMLFLASCGSKEAEKPKEDSVTEETEATEETEEAETEEANTGDVEFSLYSGEDRLAEVEIGNCFSMIEGIVGVKGFALSLPEDWNIKSGYLQHFENGEKIDTRVDGTLSSLISSNQINLPDKYFASFYIGTGDFDPIEPKDGETIYKVKVYGGDYTGEDKAEYTTSKDGLVLNGYRGNLGMEVIIPIHEYMYACITCMAAPGLENVTPEEFTEAIAEHVRAIALVEIGGEEATEEAAGNETEPAAPGEDQEAAAPDIGFGIPVIYNGNDISEDIMGILKEDGWVPVFAISHTVDFENLKYRGASLEIRFEDQIDMDMFDGEINNVEAIDGSGIRSIQFCPNFTIENTEHPTFEVLGVSSDMLAEDVVKVLGTLELEDPDSQLNWDNLDPNGIEESQRYDIIVGENTYDINVEYNHGKIWRMRIWKNE